MSETPEKFIHMNDNGDGTCTLIMRMGKDHPEITNVLAMDMDDLLTMYIQAFDLSSMQPTFDKIATPIPNEIGE